MKKYSFFCCFAVLLVVLFPVFANAESVTNGSINSSAKQYFAELVDNFESDVDYFVYRSGDNQASIVYGYGFKLSEDSSTISSSQSCVKITYDTRYPTGSNNYTTAVLRSDISSFSFNIDHFDIVYSSLEGFPGLVSKSNRILTYILYAFIAFLLLFVVFKFLHRGQNKRGVSL